MRRNTRAVRRTRQNSCSYTNLPAPLPLKQQADARWGGAHLALCTTSHVHVHVVVPFICSASRHCDQYPAASVLFRCAIFVINIQRPRRSAVAIETSTLIMDTQESSRTLRESSRTLKSHRGHSRVIEETKKVCAAASRVASAAVPHRTHLRRRQRHPLAQSVSGVRC